MKNKAATLMVVCLLASFCQIAWKQGDEISLMSALYGRDSANFIGVTNRKFLIAKDTTGTIEDFKDVPGGTGFYVTLTNGDHKGEKVWVFQSKVHPELSLYSSKTVITPDTQVPNNDAADAAALKAEIEQEALVIDAIKAKEAAAAQAAAQASPDPSVIVNVNTIIPQDTSVAAGTCVDTISDPAAPAAVNDTIAAADDTANQVPDNTQAAVPSADPAPVVVVPPAPVVQIDQASVLPPVAQHSTQQNMPSSFSMELRIPLAKNMSSAAKQALVNYEAMLGKDPAEYSAKIDNMIAGNNMTLMVPAPQNDTQKQALKTFTNLLFAPKQMGSSYAFTAPQNAREAELLFTYGKLQGMSDTDLKNNIVIGSTQPATIVSSPQTAQQKQALQAIIDEQSNTVLNTPVIDASDDKSNPFPPQYMQVQAPDTDATPEDTAHFSSSENCTAGTSSPASDALLNYCSSETNMHSFTLSNVHSNHVNPTGQFQYVQTTGAIYGGDGPHRDFEFLAPDRARQDMGLEIDEWGCPSSGDDSACTMLTDMVFFPRKVMPAISVVDGGAHYQVTLPTGETVLYDAKTKEIVGGALKEGPIDTNPNRFARKYADVQYTGKGIVVRSSARGVDPKDGSSPKSLHTPTVITWGNKTCTVAISDMWNQGSESFSNKFPTDAGFYAMLKQKCNWDVSEKDLTN